MIDPERAADAEARHAAPYRPEDFTKVQSVPPTSLQRAVAKLKIIGVLTGVLIVGAFCARVAEIA